MPVSKVRSRASCHYGASTYHGLQTQLNRRFTNGLQFQAAYTFSHMIDNGTADFFSTVIAPRRPQNFLDLASERSNSLLDHRHRFTLSTVYDMPFFSKSTNWLQRNLLGNYEFGAVYTWESGQWGTAQSGVDSNLNADSAPDRPIFNPAGTPGVGSNIINLCNSSLPAGHFCNNDPDTTFDPSPLCCCVSGGKRQRTVHCWPGRVRCRIHPAAPSPRPPSTTGTST